MKYILAGVICLIKGYLILGYVASVILRGYPRKGLPLRPE